MRLGEQTRRGERRGPSWLKVGAGVLVWMVATALVAASGVLRRFDWTPPPFALLLLAITVIGIAVPLSPLGTLLVRGLPLWALVGSQVFRFPLELVMHRASLEGVMPTQTPTGWRVVSLSTLRAMFCKLWPMIMLGTPQANSTTSTPR